MFYIFKFAYCIFNIDFLRYEFFFYMYMYVFVLEKLFKLVGFLKVDDIIED